MYKLDQFRIFITTAITQKTHKYSLYQLIFWAEKA